MAHRLIWAATHYPPAHLGGSAESIRLQAEALVQDGDSVTAVTPRWDVTAPAKETVGGVTVRRFWPGRICPEGSLPGNRTAPDRMPSEWAFMRPRWHWRVLRALLQAGPADLYHAQDRRVILATWLAARWRRRPCVLTLRDVGLLCPIAICLHRDPTRIPGDCGQAKLWRECAHDYIGNGVSWRLRLRLAVRYAWLAFERRVARRFQTVTAVSVGLERVYRTAWRGVEWAAPVPSLVVAPRQGLPSRPLGQPMLVLFVGKPSAGKGWPVVLRVVEWAAATHARSIRFAQIGPRPSWDPRAFVSNLLLLGPLAPSQVAAWMGVSDVVVVPPITCDALPRVALEAQAHGKPVVATRVGGLPEIVEDRVTGRLIPPGDWQALRDALLELASDPALRQRWGQAAQARMRERFGPARTTEILRGIYAQVGVGA